MTNEIPMTNDQCAFVVQSSGRSEAIAKKAPKPSDRPHWSLGVGNWSFFGHWSLVIYNGVIPSAVTLPQTCSPLLEPYRDTWPPTPASPASGAYAYQLCGCRSDCRNPKHRGAAFRGIALAHAAAPAR